MTKKTYIIVSCFWIASLIMSFIGCAVATFYYPPASSATVIASFPIASGILKSVTNIRGMLTTA